MRPVLYILVGFLMASAVGCDGHIRVLYLQQPGMAKPPWSVASTTIAVSGDEDVARLVQDVARTLGLASDNRLAGYIATTNDHGGSLTMRASQEENGRWVISLLDWPSFTRSQKSVDAEKEIRKALSSGAYRGHAAAG
jgi:hypothetical protein